MRSALSVSPTSMPTLGRSYPHDDSHSPNIIAVEKAVVIASSTMIDGRVGAVAIHCAVEFGNGSVDDCSNVLRLRARLWYWNGGNQVSKAKERQQRD